MIAEIFLNLIMGMFTNVFNFITAMFPAVTFTQDIAQIMADILSISNQALNFCHFVLGNHMVIILPSIFALLVYKYLVYPIIDTLRRMIPFTNL